MAATEMAKEKSSLFGDFGNILETGVKLFAATQGAGAFAGANVLLGLSKGESLDQAIGGGLNSFLNATALGPAAAVLPMFGMDAGGVGSAETRGIGSFMKSLSSESGQQNIIQTAALGALVGGPKMAGQLVLQSVMNPNLSGSDLMGGIMQEYLRKQDAVRFENVMSPTEMAQYDTGERRPDYTGTVLPDTPRVQMSAMGGMIDGPGTGTSDSIPATIYQNGGPVQEARLSDGEFVMTADAVRGAGDGDRDVGAANMYRMMNQFEGAA